MNIRYGVKDPKEGRCTPILGGYVFSEMPSKHGLKENYDM
jgi:hypothetical protein